MGIPRNICLKINHIHILYYEVKVKARMKVRVYCEVKVLFIYTLGWLLASLMVSIPE